MNAQVIEFPGRKPENDQPQTPRCPPIINADIRSREHLNKLMKSSSCSLSYAAPGGRMVELDTLLIPMAYRHGLRASELPRLRWEHADLKPARFT
jgi:integrase